MLDLNHPQSKHVLEVSGILDEVRAELLALEAARGSAEIIGRTEHICLVLIPKLHVRNQQNFANSPVIAQTLALLAKETEALNYKRALEHLIDLEGRPGRDNFGTWAI